MFQTYFTHEILNQFKRGDTIIFTCNQHPNLAQKSEYVDGKSKNNLCPSFLQLLLSLSYFGLYIHGNAWGLLLATDSWYSVIGSVPG